MGIINERLKEERAKLGYTLLDVAKLLSVEEATVQRYESGKIKNIPYETVERLSEIYHCSPAHLMGWDAPAKVRKKVPVLSKIAAHRPLFAPEQIERFEEVDDDSIDFILRVNGDSMTGARVYDGDILFVSKEISVENGDIVIAIVDGVDAIAKRYYRYGNKIVLRSENPTIKETQYDLKEVNIIGKVISAKINL